MGNITKLDIINSSLRQLKLPQILNLDDMAMKTFPYNLINDFLDDAILFLNAEFMLDYSLTDKELYFDDYNKASLDINGIIPTRIEQIYFKKDLSYFYPTRISPERMKSIWGNIQKISDVQNWSITKNDLLIAPQPLEPAIYVRYYSPLEYLITENDTSEILPDKYVMMLSQFLTNCIASTIGKDTKSFYDLFESSEIASNLTNQNNFANGSFSIPRNIRF